MTILPREQLVQRHDATVSAPGVVLWHSTTNLTTCEVHNVDLVTEGEVEEAQMAPDSFFWDVVIYPLEDVTYFGYGLGPFGEEPFGSESYEVDGDPYGLYQDPDFVAGHPDQYVTHGPIYWGDGDNGENGVYP